MKVFTKAFAVGVAATAGLALATSASAMIAPFGGAANGTDPLGQTWVTDNTFGPAWGEPGLGLGNQNFNPAGNTDITGNNWANRLSFIFLEGVNGSVLKSVGNANFTDTRFYDQTTNQFWLKSYVGNDKVVFTAPTGSRISMGDSFFVNVDFTGPVDVSHFSFAGLWTDAGGSVPEPATWAMMLMGFGLIGMTARRQRRGAVAA